MSTLIHRYFIARSGPFYDAMRNAAHDDAEIDAARENIRQSIPGIASIVTRNALCYHAALGATLEDGAIAPEGLRASKSLGEIDGRPIYVPSRRSKPGKQFAARLSSLTSALNAQRKKMRDAQEIVLGRSQIEIFHGHSIHVSTAGFVNGIALICVPVVMDKEPTQTAKEKEPEWMPQAVAGLEEVSEYEFNLLQERDK